VHLPTSSYVGRRVARIVADGSTAPPAVSIEAGGHVDRSHADMRCIPVGGPR
jgi:hypothetical protein